MCTSLWLFGFFYWYMHDKDVLYHLVCSTSSWTQGCGKQKWPVLVWKWAIFMLNVQFCYPRVKVSCRQNMLFRMNEGYMKFKLIWMWGKWRLWCSSMKKLVHRVTHLLQYQSRWYESKPCECICVSKLGGALNTDVNDDATHNGQFSLQQNKISCKIWWLQNEGSILQKHQK